MNFICNLPPFPIYKRLIAVYFSNGKGGVNDIDPFLSYETGTVIITWFALYSFPSASTNITPVFYPLVSSIITLLIGVLYLILGRIGAKYFSKISK